MKISLKLSQIFHTNTPEFNLARTRKEVKEMKLIEKEWFTDYSDSHGLHYRRYLDEENECFLIGIDEKGTKYYYVETQYDDHHSDLIMGVEEDFAFVHRLKELTRNNCTLAEWHAFDSLMKSRTVELKDFVTLHRLLQTASTLYDMVEVSEYGTGVGTAIETELINAEIANNCKVKLKLIKNEIVELLSC